jgi:hypothetical protein
MEGSAAARPEDRDPVVAELDGLSSLNGAEAAALAERVVDEAAQPSAGADRSAQLDAAVVRALCETVSPEAILEQIDPARLGSMLERCTARLRQADSEPDPEARRQLWDLLDLLRRPALLRRIDKSEVEGWATRFLTAIETSHLTVGALFRQRAEYYGSKTLFLVPQARGRRAVSWRQAASRVERIARGLIAVDPDGEPAPVAILCENRLDMALTDLACLTNGLIDVMVPATSTPKDVGFMLRHSKVRTVVVSDQRQLTKVIKNREKLPDLRNIVIIDTPGRRPQEVVSLDEVIARAESVPAAKLSERAERVRIDDLATVMYTSGTTGTPKGIQFSQRNLVFKRFARALALPEIGENDVLLCFLPLFHTFGRYLEMLGCIFWGATYCFLENPSLDALVRGMKRYRPSVFISVPKRWIELHETITRHRRGAARRNPTGNRRPAAPRALRGGLPRPGHLPLFPAPGCRAMQRLRHDRGHRRHHHDAPGGLSGRIARRAPTRGRSEAGRGRRDAGPRALRDDRLPRPARRRAELGRGRLAGDGRPFRAGPRWSLPAGRSQERDLQERQGRDDRAAACGEPVPRLRFGGAGLPGRGPPRVQRHSHLPQP